MLTATYNGVQVSSDNGQELAEFVKAIWNGKVDITAKPVKSAPVCKTDQAIVRNSTATHTFECGHTLPATRGRYSALCPNCKTTGPKITSQRNSNSGNSSKVRLTAEQRETRRQAFLASPAANRPASPEQIERIQGQANLRKMSKSARKEILSALSGVLTAGAASELYHSLKTLPIA